MRPRDGCAHRIATLAVLVAPLGAQTAIERAHSAHRSHTQVADAIARYREVLDDGTAAVADRALAGRRLGQYAWQFERDIDKARAVMHRALRFATEPFRLHYDLALFEADANRFESARERMVAARNAATSPIEVKDADLGFARIVLSEAQAADVAPDEVAAALHGLERAREVFPEDMMEPELRLGCALLLGDGPLALRAWRDHFRVDRSMNETVASAHTSLAPVLAAWRRETLTRERREALIGGLAKSRLYDHAALVARRVQPRPRRESARVASILAYHRFTQDVTATTYAFYRATAFAGGQSRSMQAEFRGAVREHQRQLWSAIRPGDPFTRTAFANEIEARFGAIITGPSFTSGYLGLYGGHVVADATVTVEQYGHEVEGRFVTLDSMIATDYHGWYGNKWEFYIGGWANWSDARVVHVRRGYYNRTPLVWNRLVDETALDAWRAEIRELAAGDDELAEASPVAFLPGLQARLKLRTFEALLQRARRGEDPRRRFVAELEALTFHGSILLHEGRHIIDNTLGERLTAADREFHAKLSEVALSEWPFWQLALNVLTPAVGGSGPHGQANARLLRGVVAWMEGHTAGIDGFDPSRPTLPQLDRLTPAQLRHAVATLDPLAN